MGQTNKTKASLCPSVLNPSDITAFCSFSQCALFIKWLWQIVGKISQD